MTDLDDIETAVDARARTAAASLHRAAAHRAVASAHPVPSGRRHTPVVLAVGAIALVTALLVIQWQRRDDVASRPLDPPVYVIDGWDITAADLPDPAEWPDEPVGAFPWARATYLATPDQVNGPAAMVLVTSMTFDVPRGPVTEGRAGRYEVVLSEGAGGRRLGEIRTDLRDSDDNPLLIRIETTGLSAAALLSVVGSLRLLDDRTPTLEGASLPLGLVPVATDDYWSSRLPIIAGMRDINLADVNQVVKPFQVVEQTRGGEVIRIATMPNYPATWVRSRIESSRRIGGDLFAEWAEIAGSSVAWQQNGSIVLASSAELTADELATVKQAARPMTGADIPKRAIGIAGVDVPPTVEFPSATEAPTGTEAPSAEEAPAPTDSPVEKPDESEVEEVALSFGSELLSANEVRLSGATDDGQPFGADIALVFDRIRIRNDSSVAAGYGPYYSPWSDQFLVWVGAGDLSGDDWLDQYVVSTDRVDAAAFEALSSDGRRYRAELVSVPARPEVKFALIAMKHGTWVSARLVDANGDTLVAYDSNGVSIAG